MHDVFFFPSLQHISLFFSCFPKTFFYHNDFFIKQLLSTVRKNVEVFTEPQRQPEVQLCFNNYLGLIF